MREWGMFSKSAPCCMGFPADFKSPGMVSAHLIVISIECITRQVVNHARQLGRAIRPGRTAYVRIYHNSKSCGCKTLVKHRRLIMAKSRNGKGDVFRVRGK